MKNIYIFFFKYKLSNNLYSRITRNAVAGTEVASGSTVSAPPAQAATTSSAGPTDVLEIDDIESLLSRLHGKEN